MWAKSQNTKKTIPVKKQVATLPKQTPAIFTAAATSNSPIEAEQPHEAETVKLEKEEEEEEEEASDEAQHSPKDNNNQENLKVLILVPHITVLIRRFLKKNKMPLAGSYQKFLNNLICLSC